MLAEIAGELIDVLVGKLHVVEANELGPSEAEGAVGVTGLTVGWEEERGLVVLVLNAGNGLAVDGRHVVGHLPGRVGIQFELDLSDRGIEVSLDPGIHERFDAIKLRDREHVSMGECQSEDGVVRDRIPVNQLFHDVFVRPEWQHGRHHFKTLPEVGVEGLPFGGRGDVGAGHCFETLRLIEGTGIKGRICSLVLNHGEAISIGSVVYRSDAPCHGVVGVTLESGPPTGRRATRMFRQRETQGSANVRTTLGPSPETVTENFRTGKSIVVASPSARPKRSAFRPKPSFLV